MLSQRDYEEFQRIIRTSKYSPGDLEISTIDYVDKCEHLYSEFTRVTIRHTVSGVTRTYIAGFASSWLHILEQDMENGTFDGTRREEQAGG